MKMSFDAINPYIRYCHSFEITRGMPFVGVRAYEYRLMYIVSGEGHIEVDGTKYEAKKGCLFYWQPGILYSLLPSINKPFTILGINFDFTCNHSDISYPVPPENSDLFDPENIIEEVVFTDLELFNKPIYIKTIASAENLLLEIVYEYATRKKLYPVKMRGAFLSLLSDVARHMMATGPAADSTESMVDQVIAYIHENYGSPINNHDIGQHFSFHPIYINRLMVKYTGTSLHQYLINYRISVALDLLQATNKPVTEIAFTVGFKDINYFSKCFKKVVGLSPKNYLSEVRS